MGPGLSCGVPSPPQVLELEGAGAAGPRVLTSRRWAGAPPAGAADWRSPARTPPSRPHSQPCVLGAMIIARKAREHAWLSLRLHLARSTATSTFTLRLLTPAARGVPGGLIKFDPFFPVKYHSPHHHHSSPPPLCLPSAPALGSLPGCLPSPAWPSSMQSQEGEWGCSSSCGAVGGGCSRRLPRCSGPKFTREVQPRAPLPFTSPERGAEPPRECVNFLAGGSCPRPEWAAFRRGARGAPCFVYLYDQQSE